MGDYDNLVKKIKKEAILKGVTIHRRHIDVVLSALGIEHEEKDIPLSKIRDSVVKITGLDITSKIRTDSNVFARMMFFRLGLANGYNYTHISKLANVDRTIAYSYASRHKQYMKNKKDYRDFRDKYELLVKKDLLKIM